MWPPEQTPQDRNTPPQWPPQPGVPQNPYPQYPYGGYVVQRRGMSRKAMIFWILFVIAMFAIPLVILAAVFGGLNNLFGGIGGLGDAIATASAGVLPETRPISGDVSRFDPLASLTEARAFAGEGVQLASLRAAYIRADGTMDLNATYDPKPDTEYVFVREVPRPENAPPVGVAGSTDGPWYEVITIRAYQPGQTSRITSTGGGINFSGQFTNQGYSRRAAEPTTSLFDPPTVDPACPFTQLWSVALERGAPADAVAIITYDADGYTLVISGVVSLEFDANCQMVG